MKQRTKINTNMAAALWASAFVLGGMILLQAGRLPGNPAYADQALSSYDYTLLTTDAGRGEDAAPDELLYVIDNRSETLMVYEVEDARKQEIILRGGGSLRNLFTNARR